MTYLNSFPVRRLYIWNGAFIIVGVSVGLNAALDLWAGKSGILLWVMVFSGLLMVIGAAYEALTNDPNEYKISDYWLALVIFGALLTLTGFVVQFLELVG